MGDRQCYGIRLLRDECPKSRCEYPYWRALRADARLRIPGGCLGLWISGGVRGIVGGWECRRITGQRPELVDRSLPACPLGGLLGLSRSLPLELREGRARFSSHVMPSDCRPGRAGYEVLMPLGGTRSASWPLRSASLWVPEAQLPRRSACWHQFSGGLEVFERMVGSRCHRPRQEPGAGSIAGPDSGVGQSRLLAHLGARRPGSPRLDHHGLGGFKNDAR